MEMRHTPLPWRKEDHQTAPCDIVGPNGNVLAHVFFTDEEEGEANADLVVRAVNSHDDLLAACKHAVHLLNSDGKNSASSIVGVCLAAIAKGEKVKP